MPKKSTEKKIVRFPLRIPAETYDKLKIKAAEEGRSANSEICRAIDAHAKAKK
jgi:hypothetical protein